ncbi:hypothetical protein CYLTODRAFT_427358 [Cylindrobasidium torrendii FP15055 ss-10]|uniref:Uncharacterized protein n=1 Tax=Cylindrobasidium torrendii FP15055 ss-10 TaxID=1314674 RepID=A0A0D7ATR6_9AGAR|nr:hypothetical protein CYLTODRAFT_427358 [Cylindrobasidium torrendii FP15055 ss-10]
MSSRLTLSEMTKILEGAFKRLLEMNAPPSDTEALEIRSLIRNLRYRMADIPRYNVFMDAERDDIQRAITAHEALLSPARYLPAEILMQIFSYTIEGYFDVLRVDAGPWVLSHVSRSWRYVATACPELWTSFVLPWETLQPRPSGAYELLESVLSRTCNSPLSITFTPEAATPGANFFYQRLLSESHRWKNARIFVPNNVYDAFNQQLTSLPRLKSLELVVDLVRAEKESPSLFAPFEAAPRLQNVAISGTKPLATVNLPKVRLPWAQLTRFSTEHIRNIDHLIEILHNTPKLRELELPCLKWHHPKYAESLGVHEGVESLRIWDPRLLDYLCLPSMRSIDLELDIKDKYATALGKFVARSQCSPRRLRLVNARPEERLTLLKDIPSLSHLIIEEGFHGREHVESLFKSLHRESGEELLPHLEHFEWTADISCFQFDGKCMLDMIESRWRLPVDSEVTRLRSVKVSCRTFRSKLSTIALRRVAKLRAEGLDIDIAFVRS